MVRTEGNRDGPARAGRLSTDCADDTIYDGANCHERATAAGRRIMRARTLGLFLGAVMAILARPMMPTIALPRRAGSSVGQPGPEVTAGLSSSSRSPMKTTGGGAGVSLQGFCWRTQTRPAHARLFRMH